MVYWPMSMNRIPSGSFTWKRFFEKSIIDGYLDDSLLYEAHKECTCTFAESGAIPNRFNTLPHRGTGPHRFNVLEL